MTAPDPAAALNAFAAAVAARIGADAVVTDPDAIAPWLADWRGRYHGASTLLLQPRTTPDVATVCSLR